MIKSLIGLQSSNELVPLISNDIEDHLQNKSYLDDTVIRKTYYFSSNIAENNQYTIRNTEKIP